MCAFLKNVPLKSFQTRERKEKAEQPRAVSTEASRLQVSAAPPAGRPPPPPERIAPPPPGTATSTANTAGHLPGTDQRETWNFIFASRKVAEGWRIPGHTDSRGRSWNTSEFCSGPSLFMSPGPRQSWGVGSRCFSFYSMFLFYKARKRERRRVTCFVGAVK